MAGAVWRTGDVHRSGKPTFTSFHLFLIFVSLSRHHLLCSDLVLLAPRLISSPINQQCNRYLTIENLYTLTN